MPDPSITSDETGTRHRTAERVAKQTGFPVVSVSQSMNIIGLYVGGRRYVLEDSAAILSRANQALATLERYKLRLDEVSSTLSDLEIEDLVSVRDVAVVTQRLEMVRRIAREIDEYVIELGSDGRLLSLQLRALAAEALPASEPALGVAEAVAIAKRAFDVSQLEKARQLSQTKNISTEEFDRRSSNARSQSSSDSQTST